MTLRFLLSAVAVSVLLASCQSQPSSKPYSAVEEIAELQAEMANEPSIHVLATQNKNWQQVYPDVWVLDNGSEDGLPFRRVKIENSPSGMAWALENIDQKDIALAEKLIAQSSDENVRQRLQSRLGGLRSLVANKQVTLHAIKNLQTTSQGNVSSENRIATRSSCATATASARFTSATRGAKANASVGGCAAGSVRAESIGNFLGIPSGGQQNSASGYGVAAGASVSASSGSCSANSNASNLEGDSDSASTGCGQQ